MSKVSVRYIVNDVDQALPFYRDMLGFNVDMHPAPGFAMISRGDLRLLLSSPSTAPGGGQARPGAVPEPGGWNRFALEVEDVRAAADALRSAGVAFRTDVIEGVGGIQALVEDPSGNPIEIFQPTRPEARLEQPSG